jgi:hypothetical protein
LWGVDYPEIKGAIILAKTVVLTVGDIYHLGFGKDKISYAGMSSEQVYSIVRMRWEFFYRGYSWHQFYPVSKRDINIDGIDIHVENVSSDEIRLNIKS